MLVRLPKLVSQEEPNRRHLPHRSVLLAYVFLHLFLTNGASRPAESAAAAGLIGLRQRVIFRRCLFSGAVPRSSGYRTDGVLAGEALLSGGG